MFSSALRSATLAAVILFPSNSFAALSKPVLFSDGLSPHVDNSFWANLQPTQSTWDQWGAGWVPQSCRDEAKSASPALNPSDLEVYNVHYTDCDQAWVMCRHTSAGISLITMIDLFGRLPVHERQWIKHVMAVPGGGSAYMRDAVVVFQGAVGTPSVFQHEVGHSVDFYKTGSQSSNTDAFKNAFNQDSCIPDSYAGSNYVEDYTQVGVLSMYEIVTPGGLDAIGANWRCLVNQKNVLDGFQRDAMIPGGKCDRRFTDSPIVSTSSKKRDTRAPEAAIKLGQPNVFDVPFSASTEPRVYKNLHFNVTEEAKAVNRQAKWAKL